MSAQKNTILALLAVCLLLCSACAVEAPTAQTPVEKTPLAPVTSANGFAVSQPISPEQIDALRAEGKQFVVYFSGKKSSENEEKLQKKLADLVENYSDAFLCDYYTLPIGDYPGAKDLLGGNLFGVVLFRPENALVLSGDSLNDVGSAFNRFFEYELVAPDDHGLPIVDYSQVMEKIESKEPFLLYVGRDTCPQCRLFSPNLEAGLVEAGLKTPIYYFYVESYHRAQEQKEADAQDQWNADASSIGFQGTPALLYFKDGAGVTFDFFNSLFPEDAKSQEEFEESNSLCLAAMKNWIAENGIQ